MAFSPKIQALIDSSGKETAIARANELNIFATKLEQQAPLSPQQSEFSQLLKNTTNTNISFGIPKNLALQSQITSTSKTNIASELPTISGATPLPKGQILNIISQISKKHGVDEKLVQAIIKQESGFKTDAVSSAGAMGLMQLMPLTAKGLGVKDAFNPIQNIDGGVRHLKGLLAKYNNNLVLALAAYNAGGGNVDKYNGVPPFKETQNYVKNILANYLR